MQPPSLAVSVIVPMRNEEAHISACLDSILANCAGIGEAEILVVDGMSTDGSRAVVEERARRSDCIHLFSNPAKTVGAGLNIGVQAARGRVIVIMGAHAVYPRDYLAVCLRELERTGADALGGLLRTVPGANTIVARAVALMSQHSFGVGRSRFRIRQGGAYVDTVPYGAYRREVFDSIGMFEEKLVRNQDFEFNARLQRSGGRLYLSNEIETEYYNVPDCKRLVKQAFANGFWLPRMWWTTAASFRLRHVAPAAFVTLIIGALTLATVWKTAIFLAAGAVALYAAAAVVAALQIASRNGGVFFFPVLGLFFLQHMSYGLGTLAGLCGTAIPLRSRKRSHGAPKSNLAIPDLITTHK